MKHKVLLTGRHNDVIDVFFSHMKDLFEMQSSSERYEDISSHLEYFQPDIFIFCMENEDSEAIRSVGAARESLNEKSVPIVVIGEPEESDAFFIMTAGGADLTIHQPVTIEKIREELIDFIKEIDQEREKLREKKRVEEAKKMIAEEEKTRVELQQDIAFAMVKAGEERRLHILVVDDDVRMLKVIKEHLKEKYDVATAINGKLAFKFLENKKTDLILLDYMMPGEDGLSILKKLHENPSTKDVPVIFLSGMSEQNKIQEALSERPQGYILKPIDREMLLSTIRSVLH